MERPIRQVAVLGAGTMGAGIAAQVANAGLPVVLLDVVPAELEPEERGRGLTLEDREVRDRLARQGLERARRAQPPAFMSRAAERLVTVGNLEDDLGALAEVNWIVEAVVEDLETKRRLYERVEEVRRPGTVVTTNTSGLPIASLAEGRSDDFRRSFFGTHFFNPPRYMRLVEVIRGEEADPLLVSELAELLTRGLGKTVVFAKDTPNFIANRILSVHSWFLIEHALENGYRIEEVDALTGPLIGRPRTATFRVQDLVGVDVARAVGRNLHERIPHDFYRPVLEAPRTRALVEGLIERGRLGNKSGQGFYRRSRQDGGWVYEVIDPETFEYGPQRETRFAAVEEVRGERDLGARLRALFSEERRERRGAELAWAAVRHFLAYAAEVAQEIAYDVAAIDDAVRLGFGYELGPFELWDRMGVAETAERMEASGIEVADWVKEMLFAEVESFYRRENGRVTGCYDWTTQAYGDQPEDERELDFAAVRAADEPLASDPAASLHDLGDGVLGLELHAPGGVFGAGALQVVNEALHWLESDAYLGLVLGSGGDDFSTGADLGALVEALDGGGPQRAGARAGEFQCVLAGVRRAPKPVVAAIAGRSLGSGLELALAASRIVAHAETYAGLVEAAAGLVPTGGGAVELLRRAITPAMEIAETDPLPRARRVLETLATARVSTSAAEARDLGFLGPRDRIVMLRDHLLFEAKQEVLAMVADGYLPPPPAELYAGGRELSAALEMGVWTLEQSGYASAQDGRVARALVRILAGGDLSAPQLLGEEHFLELERRAFVELAASELTQARIRHLLETGKPLRN